MRWLCVALSQHCLNAARMRALMRHALLVWRRLTLWCMAAMQLLPCLLRLSRMTRTPQLAKTWLTPVTYCRTYTIRCHMLCVVEQWLADDICMHPEHYTHRFLCVAESIWP